MNWLVIFFRIDDDEDSPEDFSPWELERPSDDNSDAEPETDDDDLRQALPETIIEYSNMMHRFGKFIS